MPPERRAPDDSQLADLDAAGTIDLCTSLADYAEAGGLSRDLMLRVGDYAQGSHAADLNVMLAVARMYHAASELELARAVLLQVGKRAPRDARVLRLLRDVLRDLGVEDSPAEVLANLADEPRSARTEELARAAPTQAPPAALRPRSQRPTRPQLAVVAPAPELGNPPLEPTSARRGAGTYSEIPAALEEPRKVAASVAAPLAAWDEPPPSRPAPQQPAPRARAESVRPPRACRIKLLGPDDPQRRLGPYELIGELAGGGLSEVFLARCTTADGVQRVVAIKRFQPRFAREAEFLQLSLAEAHLAAAVRHPNVAPIFEIAEGASGHALVMAFIEGDTLATLASRAFSLGVTLPFGIAVRIVIDALKRVFEYPHPNNVGFGPRAPFSRVYESLLKEGLQRADTTRLIRLLAGYRMFDFPTGVDGRLFSKDWFGGILSKWLAALPAEKVNDFLNELHERASQVMARYPRDKDKQAIEDRLAEMYRIEEKRRFGAESKSREKELLTKVVESDNITPVKLDLARLLKRLNDASRQRGQKTALAKHMGVALPNLSHWLSGEREPGGEATLQLLNWVELQEAKQQKSPEGVDAPPEPKTRVRKSQHEKQTQVRKKT